MTEPIMPWLIGGFGIILSALLTLINGNMNRLLEMTRKFDADLSEHIQKSEIHEAGFARTNEQILNLMSTVKLAHSRIDKVQAKL